MRGKRAKELRKQVAKMMPHSRSQARRWAIQRRVPEPEVNFKTVYRRVKKLYMAGVYV